MADVTLTIAHRYDDGDTAMENFGVVDLGIDVTTRRPSWKKIVVNTVEQALDLDGITAARAMLIGINRDDTDFMHIRMASGGSRDDIYLPPGEPCCFRFGDDVTAPYLIADTASLLFEYRLVPL